MWVSIRTCKPVDQIRFPLRDGLLVDPLQDVVDVAPPAGVILVEFLALVDHLQAEDVALIELERAEGERFELARAEGVVGAEFVADLRDRPGVVEPAVVGAELALDPATVGDLEGVGRAQEPRGVPRVAG